MYNCHAHIFTIKNIPINFIPFGLVRLLIYPKTNATVQKILKHIWPFSADYITNRLAIFSRHISLTDQKTTFDCLCKHYPIDTKFVILPMDFEYTNYKKTLQSTEEQLNELYELTKIFNERIIPFVPVDPRRKDLITWTRKWIEEKGFKGIKMYPSLGFYPTDEALMPIWEYAEKYQIPITTHCGGIFIRNKKTSSEKIKDYIKPRGYLPILKSFPNLKLCLSHFGGGAAWDEALQLYGNETEETWVKDIRDMIAEYPNVYSDTSYTMFENTNYIPYLKLLLQDEKIASRILFGTDYYMVDFEGNSEKMMCVLLRHTLGEDLWKQISEINPVNWLN